MNSEERDAVISGVRFGADGLIPAVIQEAGAAGESGRVLMLAWMDAEALGRTLTEGVVTFWSRSRQEYWRKGDTSRNQLRVRTAALDCDADTALFTVDAVSAACHTGAHSCFDVQPIPVDFSGGTA